MGSPVSNQGTPVQNNQPIVQPGRQQNNSNAAIDSLPHLVLARIFEFASRDQEGFETTAAIRATSRNWQNINDETLLPNLYYHVKTALGNHPFFQTIPAFNAIMNATPEQMKSSALFKDLSRAFNAPCLLFPEQYLRSYQELEDHSLVTVWDRIRVQINFHEDEPIPREAQEIRDWINNPENAERIQAITRLDLQSMNLRLLPQEIGAFVNLEELTLSDNHLNILPETIGNLENLITLDLENNHLQSLPASFGNLQHLIWLSLNNNPIENLPESFGSLQELHSLYLNNNRLKGLPESFGSLKLLQRLSLNNNQLERLPESFGNLQQLEWLSLTGNQLEGLPNTFGNFQQLTELYLNNNLLKSLPDTFGNLRQLQRLHLENNQLESLPGSFGNFQQLIELYLNNNLLKSLPETFGNLQQLQHLFLHCNLLENLPETFGNLHLLTALYLNNNHLQSLPNTLGNLQRLSGLFLSNNQLYCLPETFRNLQQLKILSLFFNSCLFMFDKELSAFTSNYSQRPLEKYRACRDYVPSTPIARLCQLIHNQTDKDLLEPTLRSIPRSMQAKLRSRIEDIWASLAEHEQVENKDLLRANAVRAACHERVEVLNQAIIEVLKETFADFTEEQKRLVYDLVWDLAGRPEGDDNWGENHAEDNIIRLIDAVAIVLSEQGQG